MADQPVPEGQPPFAVPPTERFVPPPAPKAPVWPTVIGVIAIVYGGLNILCGLFGMLSSEMFSGFGGSPSAASSPELEGLRPSTIVMGVISTALMAVLVVIGIGILRRQRWSMTAARAWAVAEIVASLVGMVVGYKAQQAVAAGMAAGPGGGPPPAMMAGMMMVGMVVGLIVACSLPIFLLIWFGRAKIKAEVAAWA